MAFTMDDSTEGVLKLIQDSVEQAEFNPAERFTETKRAEQLTRDRISKIHPEGLTTPEGRIGTVEALLGGKRDPLSGDIDTSSRTAIEQRSKKTHMVKSWLKEHGYNNLSYHDVFHAENLDVLYQFAVEGHDPLNPPPYQSQVDHNKFIDDEIRADHINRQTNIERLRNEQKKWTGYGFPLKK